MVDQPRSIRPSIARANKRLSIQSALSVDSVPEADEDDLVVNYRRSHWETSSARPSTGPIRSLPGSRAASPPPTGDKPRLSRSRPSSVLSARPGVVYSASCTGLASLATSSAPGRSSLHSSHTGTDQRTSSSPTESHTEVKPSKTFFSGPEADAKMADKRWRIALELRESERTYAAVLDDIQLYYHHPLLQALPIALVPPSRRASMRTSQASSASHVAVPSQGERSRPVSMSFTPSTLTPPTRSSSLGPLARLPFPPSEAQVELALDAPPLAPVLSHATLEAIFSNIADVRSLSQLILATLEKAVPDLPTAPKSLLSRPSKASMIEESASPSSAPATPEQPGLSSSQGTVDSISAPRTPDQRREEVEEKPHRSKSKRRSLTSPPPQPLALGKALLPLLPFLKSSAQFVANFAASTATLSALKAGNAPTEGDDPSAFAAFLGARKSLERGVGLGGLLLNIVQRVPRYRFLLADLLAHTSTHHPDYTSLQEAYKIADEVASHLEAQLGQKGEDEKLIKLSRAFAGRGLEGRSLIEPGRKLLRAGRLRKLDRKGHEVSRLFFLFNDLLLHASIEGDWMGWQMDGAWVDLEASFRARKVFSLEHVTVVGAEDRSIPMGGGTEEGKRHVFEVLAPEKSFALFAESAKEKLDWIEAIREAKAALMSDRRTLQRVDTSTSLASKMRAGHKSGLSLSNPIKRDRRISLPAPSSPAFDPSASRVSTHRNRTSAVPSLQQIPGTPSPEVGLLGTPVVTSPKLLTPSPSFRGSVKSPAQLVNSTSAEDYFALPIPRSTTPASISPSTSEGLFVMEGYNAPIWVPDNAAERCANCSETFFGAWRRKHHCRLCGDVVCWACSQRQFVIPAPESEAQEGEGEGEEDKVARACDKCWESVVLPRLAGTPAQLVRARAGGGEGSLSRVGGTVVAEFVQPRGGVGNGKGTVRTRLRSFKR